MFDEETSRKLDELTVAYKDLCIGYIAEVGKLGSQNNGITIQWMVKSTSGRRLRKLVQDLKTSYLERSREEKYYLLREVFALKPGVHERFYASGHEGKVLTWIQKEFNSRNKLDAKCTLFLKSMIVIENFYDLEPFLYAPENWSFPSTLKSAQASAKFLLESQNWKSLEMLKPLDSWMNYAPCGINCGPFVKRNGNVLFQSLNYLGKIAIGYAEVIYAAGYKEKE